MRTVRLHCAGLVLLLTLLGCSPPAPGGSRPVPGPASSTPASSTPAGTTAPRTTTTPRPAPATPEPTRTAPGPTPQPTPQPTAERTGPDDPRWQFFVDDETRYRSPWFDGAQRVMIGYGCTRAPFYRPDGRCRDGDGFHHGIDVALPCRTTLRAGVAGRVIDPDRPGRPGPAYGSTAFRLRVTFRGERYDVLIGHATEVFVRPGDRVRAGARIATAGARGAPDGCHLHLEQRRVDGGVAEAVDPARLLALRAT